MLRVMLLCAGFGTRLLPLTRICPKPLMPVGDRPGLWHVCSWLRRCGITEAVGNLHHLADEFTRIIDELPITLQVVHEPSIRGTAGGVAGARLWLGSSTVVVYNADILAQPNLEQLAGAVDEQGLCLAVAPRRCGEGSVGLDRNRNVVRLRGERFGQEVEGGDYIGVAALGSRVVASLPDEGCLVGDVALPWLRQGRTVRTAAHAAGWSDIGDLRSYLESNLSWLGEHAARGGSWCGPGASVGAGVSLEQCVIGAGARIGGTGLVSRSVVWPGARVFAPFSNAIAHGHGQIVRVGS